MLKTWIAYVYEWFSVHVLAFKPDIDFNYLISENISCINIHLSLYLFGSSLSGEF